MQVAGNGILYIVRRERAQAFILLGAGVAHSTSETNFADYHSRRSGAGFLANAGAGVKLFLNRHIALRPEIRMVGTSAGSTVDEPFSAELRLSLGLGYSW